MDDHGLDDWSNEDDVAIPDDLPEPILWRCLVMPVRPKTKTASGILLADSAQDAQRQLGYIGKILKMGDLCFEDGKFAGQTNKPKVGDWVGFGKFAGQPITFRGLRLILLNDDHIMFVSKSGPDGYRVHI